MITVVLNPFIGAFPILWTLKMITMAQKYATDHIQKLKELNDMTEMLKLRAAEADK